MMASLLIVTLFLNLLAPLPPQIAINPETKECGNYWGGDEYAGYYLSPPWKIINYGTPVHIGTGVYKWGGSISTSSVESFCNQIGYTYVSGNLGQMRGQYSWTAYAVILLIFQFGPLIIGLIIVLMVVFFLLRWLENRSNNALIP